MPYRLNPDNPLCVQIEQNGAWENLKCHETQSEAKDHLTALHMNVQKTFDDRRIYFGGAVKALGNGRFEGMLLAFTDTTQRDLHGQYFKSGETDLMLNDYPIENCKLLYHHGLDETIGVKPIGKILKSEYKPDAGVWLQGQLSLVDDYEKMIYQLVEQGKIGFSSGALPQSVVVNDDGLIKRWCVIEASLTPTPAEPFLTRISPLKSLLEMTHEGAQAKDADVQPAINSVNDSTANESGKPLDSETAKQSEETMTPEQLKELFMQFCQEMGLLPASPEAQVAMPAMEAANTELPPTATDQEKLDQMKAVVMAGMKAANAEINKRRDAIKGVIGTALAEAKAAPGIPTPMQVGQQSGTPKRPQHISVSENLKYAHLSAMDMAMAFKAAVAAKRMGLDILELEAAKSTDFVSEDFYRHAMHKMYAEVEKTTFSRPVDAQFVKSITPFKADELDATDITGQGLEYLGTVYDQMVWESARNIQIYKLMQQRGMMEKPVPKGAATVKVPIEGSDPTVYGGVEANSVDSTGQPETVYAFTPITTSTIDVTPGTFRTATAYTFNLDEDSFVDMGQEANRKIRLALEEHIERAFINADTATAANTNINSITGTPTSTGLTKDYYLEFNGLRKSPLVTSTAYSRDGGALSIDDYRRTWKLLGSTQAPKVENLFFLIDFDTLHASLDLLQLTTKDVAGEAATIFTGKMQELYGIPVYMSGFLALSNTAGKIDTATPGNNTKGQILCVDASYWAFCYKRNITIEMERVPRSETFNFYGSMRLCLVRRSASAASITYNLTV